MDNQEVLVRLVNLTEVVGQALLKIQPKVRKLPKRRGDIVTNADLMSHSLILKGLQTIIPEVPIFSEEGKETIRKTGRITWIVDPIDGTFNFIHRDVFWGVSIALVENQQTQLGIVYLPALNRLIGVTKEGKVITKGNLILRVRPDRELSEALIWIDWDKKAEITPSVFVKIGRVGLRPQVRQCCSASLLAVATGNISAFIHPGPGPEDIAAGCLIVEKAGGQVTDSDGNSWTPFSDFIVASNGLLHEQILEAIK